jgi:ribonucleoside-diphosphate reductase beta chain
MRESYATTTRGLRRDAPAMRLFEKAKRLGVWNPSDIDLTQDAVDWHGLDSAEKTVLLHLTALFQAGEEAVTLDLLPLIMAIAQEGRIEEEMYLTTFLWEEAKHVDFFSRVLTDVFGHRGDLSHFVDDNYRFLFHDALPNALNALRDDPSPAAQLRASVTYNMIVEGVLAETGYHAYFSVLERHGLMPGVREGVRLLKQDESRHIAYGIYLISRLVAADPALWEVVEETMNALLMPTLAVIGDIFGRYDPMPFGLVEDEFVDFALGQFQKRIGRIESARTASLADIEQTTRTIIAADDG